MTTRFFATVRGLALSLGIVFGSPSLPCLAQTQPFAFSTLAGLPVTPGTNDGINQQARFDFPVGVTPDASGNLYVADFLNHTIRKLTRSGTNWTVTTIAGLAGTAGYADGTNSDARFNRPTGIAVDNSGNVFVAERYNHTIREISPVGTNWVVSTIAGLGSVPGQEDGIGSEARFYLPSGIAVNASNHLYVADAANFTIREIAPSGTNWIVSTIAGSVTNFGFADGTGTDAMFNFPYGIAVSRSGKLYVADWGNHAIRELAPSGANWVVHTIAGLTGNPGANDGAGTAASFNNPTGVAVDESGNVYVADQSNSAIRRLIPGQSDWIVSTVAGQPLRTGSSDGLGTNALFKKLWGIAVDHFGNIFVADYGNSTIRMGTAPAPAGPVLHITVIGTQVVLSWPATAGNLALETADSLAPDAAWQPATNGVVTVDGMMMLTNNASAAAAFYRLRPTPPVSP